MKGDEAVSRGATVQGKAVAGPQRAAWGPRIALAPCLSCGRIGLLYQLARRRC